MLVYNNQTIEDTNLEDVPMFNNNPSGLVSVSRLVRTTSKFGILKIVRELEFNGKTEFYSTGGGGGIYIYEKEIKHNLGRLTYPIGHLFLGDDFFPIPFPGSTGIDVWITYYTVDNNKLMLSVRSSVFYGEQEVKAKIYLLRETLN